MRVSNGCFEEARPLQLGGHPCKIFELVARDPSGKNDPGDPPIMHFLKSATMVVITIPFTKYQMGPFARGR